MLEKKRPNQKTEPGVCLHQGVGRRGGRGGRCGAIGGKQGKAGSAGERGDETFQMEQGDHLFSGEQYQVRNAPELRMKRPVLTSEDSLNTGAEETSV